MTMAHELIVDPLPQMVDSQDPKPLATWYAQGRSDSFGDRLLMFDNSNAPSWEILRFKPALARISRFEEAVRERAELLRSFHHPAFPLVRPVKELEHDDGLAVVSTYVSGVRLSDALQKFRSPAFAVRLIRELMPALVALHRHAPGIAHGALDTDRIVVTAGGRLMIREHMVGSALESLGLPAAQLWTDFGVLASPMRTTTPKFDDRSDVTQLALVALSLMAAHRIGPDEYPEKVDELFDEIAARSSRQALGVFQPLRYWLERALQLDDRMFQSARDANDALAELRDDAPQPDELVGLPGFMLGHVSQRTEGPENKGARRDGPRRVHLIVPDRVEESVDVTASSSSVVVENPKAVEMHRVNGPSPIPSVRRFAAGTMRWASVVVTVLAVGEAVFIGHLLSAGAAPLPRAEAAVLIESPQPGAKVLVDDKPAGVTPIQLNVGPQIRPIPVLPDAVAGRLDQKTDVPAVRNQKQAPVSVDNARADSVAAPIASPRRGGFRLSSPIELNVLDGEHVLGSSEDGPIVATAGRHEFEFVNSTIGYRVHRVVNIKAGQIISLSVTPPNGIVNINAVPWAAVWIDGNSVGETPVGNLSVPPGEHEIVFRHPQLGERREKTIVRTDAATRVTANLQK